MPFDSSANLARSPDPEAEEGFFVPATLEEALAELKRMLPAAMTRSMYCGTEDDMVHYHFSLGMWMRNNWGLWAGGDLAKYFQGRGIDHPDDMSGIILDSYWRQLHRHPVDLDAQVRYYQAYWEAHASPGPFTCPNDGTPTEPTYSFAIQGPPQPWVVYHVVDCGDGGFWSYERSEGWRPAAEAVLERIEP